MNTQTEHSRGVMMDVLLNGGYFLHRMTEYGYRTNLFDVNDEVVLGYGIADRWRLWDEGLLQRRETRATGEYLGYFTLKDEE